MAWTQSDLDAINTAIATGARRVRFQTHEVEYQTTTDLLRARDAIQREIAQQNPSAAILFAEYDGGY